MLCDSADEDTTVTRMRGALATALTNGDQLASWLLATSDWPNMYLTSRDFGTQADLWDTWAGAELDACPNLPSQMAENRSVYRQLSHGRDGLPALDVILGNALPSLVNDLASWQPTPYAPVPATAMVAR